MKNLLYSLVLVFLEISCAPSRRNNPDNDQKALIKTTEAIRSAFGRGDISAIASLHHPKVIKAFGGTNYIDGRDAMFKGLEETFKTTKLEFVGNQIENTLFNGDTAIE
ncbi:MAG: hypothetical protein ABIN24_11680 [Dyadobacter sp.]